MSFLTIFSAPKKFTDPHIDIIQRNAIQSWQHLGPDVEVILAWRIWEQKKITPVKGRIWRRKDDQIATSINDFTIKLGKHEVCAVA